MIISGIWRISRCNYRTIHNQSNFPNSRDRYIGNNFYYVPCTLRYISKHNSFNIITIWRTKLSTPHAIHHCSRINNFSIYDLATYPEESETCL